MSEQATCETCRHWSQMDVRNGECVLTTGEIPETLALAMARRVGKPGELTAYLTRREGYGAVLVTDAAFSCCCYESR